MLNDRRQRLLGLLLSAHGPLSATELGRLLGYRARSVRYDLEAISDWVADCGASLIGTAGVGYHLEGDLEEVRHSLNSLSGLDAASDYFFSPRERVRHLVLFLLSDDRIWRLHELADRLKVGKSTVHADLTAVDSWVTRRGLSLERTPSGYSLTGPEQLWRQAMVDLVMELADDGQLAMLLEDHPVGESLRELLRPLLPGLDWEALGEIIREEGVPELSVYLAVLIARLLGGHSLPDDPEQESRFRGSGQWPKASSVCSSISAVFGVSVPPTEVAVLAAQMAVVMPGIGSGDGSAVSAADLAMVKSLALLVETRLGIPASRDQDFIMGLAAHLRPMQDRLRRGQVVENPLLQEIRTRYTTIYRAAEEVARALEAVWHAALPPSEVAYLALHMLSAIERDRLKRQRVPRALVVCGSGVGASRLLTTRLQATLTEIQVGAVVSAFRVRELLAAEPYDLVITTCQVPPLDRPVVRVSPLLTDADIVRIRQLLTAMQQSDASRRQPTLREVLPPERIAMDVEARDWREAVRAAGELLVRDGLVEERYLDAVIRNTEELGPFIVLAPGFALPHARPEDGVKQVGMAMVQLREPVKFGHPKHDPVRTVCLLGAVDHERHLTSLMQLSELFGHSKSLQALCAATDVATVSAMIDQVSAQTPEIAEMPT